MERWRGRVAVVTGASSGIGAAIAYQLLDAGLTVVALARRSEKIFGAVREARRAAEQKGRMTIGQARIPGKLHRMQCDVSKEADVVKAFKWVKDNLRQVHVLVNNAGVVSYKALTESPTREWRRLLDVNVLGLSVCTREAIKLMRETGVDDGHVIHIGSVAGHLPPSVGEVAMYHATKHAVRVLTEGLRKELVAGKSNIRVTEVSPGLVRTEIFNTAKVPHVTIDDIFKQPILYPEDIADSVLYSLSVPPHVQIHEITIKPVGEAM